MNLFKLASIILSACIGLIGCARTDESITDKNSPSDPVVGLNNRARQDASLQTGVHDESLVSESGAVLRYTLAIPQTYDPGQPTPLIVALHFGGRVTPHFARSLVEGLILPGLGELNAIVLAPDSIAGPWNNDKNEKAILELMDYVDDNYNIDHSKTLLTGFSMGGHGTWYIGSRHQDRFSALIPIAGAPVVDESVVWTTPIYIIHSRADDVVPIDATEKYLGILSDEQRSRIQFAAVDDLSHFQTATFAAPLKNAVPWLKQIWEGKRNPTTPDTVEAAN